MSINVKFVGTIIVIFYSVGQKKTQLSKNVDSRRRGRKNGQQITGEGEKANRAAIYFHCKHFSIRPQPLSYW